MTDSDSQPTTIEELEWAVWPSFALLAGIRLDLFTPLKDGPMSVEQLADKLGVEADKLKPLLCALAASGLLKAENGLFSNSSEANRFLVRGLATYRGGKHEVLLNNWQAGLRTAESIRTGAPQAKLDFAGASAAELETFYRSNHAQALRRGRELVATYDLSPHHTLLDVGGGSGGLAIAVTETHPHMQATVAELPTVTPITRRIVEEAGASGRVQVQSSDVINESPSGAFDAAVLSSFIQVISRDQARRALRNVGKVVNPGGAIYIRGDIVDDSGISPLGSVMRNLVYLNIYDQGQAYTEREHREWLKEAGFENFERNILPDGFSMVRAWKAK
ncbi:MAG: methyltransferase domain-containing protein [Deltaproteobacteria bacterium]|nr:methyltransferase domain-containing protein [Deltaproteobacteria bacterium]MBI2366866.1 methyltransferase domain-containing protein [Deltaproteobacteria bacterium]MBI2533244.1 methyltransferase domain-containing protein [Deltaproteobacteria bacterium]